MIRLTSVALLLACAACAPEAKENVAEAGNAGNAVLAEPSRAAAPLPPPPENLITPPDDNVIDATAGANGIPADVQAFIERREGCEHWAGEPDYDAERRKQIEEAVRELCTGIDMDLIKLRQKYARQPGAMAALAEFEPLGMDD